jgi:hypothetical protein
VCGERGQLTSTNRCSSPLSTCFGRAIRASLVCILCGMCVLCVWCARVCVVCGCVGVVRWVWYVCCVCCVCAYPFVSQWCSHHGRRFVLAIARPLVAVVVAPCSLRSTLPMLLESLLLLLLLLLLSCCCDRCYCCCHRCCCLTPLRYHRCYCYSVLPLFQVEHSPPTRVILKWRSSPGADLVADSLVAVIGHADVSLRSLRIRASCCGKRRRCGSHGEHAPGEGEEGEGEEEEGVATEGGATAGAGAAGAGTAEVVGASGGGAGAGAGSTGTGERPVDKLLRAFEL